MPNLIITKNHNFTDIFEIAEASVYIGSIPTFKDVVNQIVLTSVGVSKTHAVIELRNGVYYITDLESTNGTFVNEECLRAYTPFSLHHGDSIKIIDYVFTFVEDTKVIRFGRKIIIDKNGKTLDDSAADNAWKFGPTKIMDLNLAAAASIKARHERLMGELQEEGVIIRNHHMLDLYDRLAKIAEFDFPVLIVGESGVGKEHIAEYIHKKSKVCLGPLVKRNCAEIPSNLQESELFGIEGKVATNVDKRMGWIEQANNGSLFLDEIADMDHSTQAKLLRVLEGSQVYRIGGRTPIQTNVRIIAATNVDINQPETRKQKQFRDDLYHRIAVFTFHVPPLNKRTDEISHLCDFFIKDLFKETLKISPDAMRKLESFDWSNGNIRELRNTIIRSFINANGKPIGPEDLFLCPTHPGEKNEAFRTLKEVICAHIHQALAQTDGKKSLAAKLLDIDRNRLTRLMKTFEME